MESTDMLERSGDLIVRNMDDTAGNMAVSTSTIIEAVAEDVVEVMDSPLNFEEANRRHRLAIEYGQGRFVKGSVEWDELVELSRRAP